MWLGVYIAAVLVLLLIALALFAAFDLMFDIKIDESGFSKKVKIRWMGISRTIGFETKEKEEKKEKKVRKKKPEKAGEKDKGWKWQDISTKDISFYIGLVRQIQGPVIRLITGIFRSFRMHSFSLDLVYGLPNPADTGMACGFLHSAMAFIGTKCNRCRYSIYPVFYDTVVDFHLVTSIRFRLFSLILPFIRFIASRNVLKVVWKVLKKKYL